MSKPHIAAAPPSPFVFSSGQCLHLIHVHFGRMLTLVSSEQNQPGFVTAPVAMQPIQGQYPITAQQPMMFQMQPQPVMIQTGNPMPTGQYVGQPAHIVGQPGVTYPGLGQAAFTPGQYAIANAAIPGNSHFPFPDIMGIGKTQGEVQAELQQASLQNECNQPQGIAPVDSNPGRMYWFRELDNNWTQRNRFTIDRFVTNDEARWYVRPDGIFYAVKLPE
jgi:hypothetical protein